MKSYSLRISAIIYDFIGLALIGIIWIGIDLGCIQEQYVTDFKALIVAIGTILLILNLLAYVEYLQNKKYYE